MEPYVMKRTDELAPGDRVARSRYTPGTATVKRIEPAQPMKHPIAHPPSHRITWDDDGWTLARPDERWRMVTPAVEEEWANQAAVFHPMRYVDERPGLEVDGALVCAYWEDGVFRVAVSTDSVDTEKHPGVDGCPVLVEVEDGPVFERTPAGLPTPGDPTEDAIHAAANVLAVALTTAEATGAETCQRAWQLAVAERMIRSAAEASR